jgi:hypothetical protein
MRVADFEDPDFDPFEGYGPDVPPPRPPQPRGVDREPPPHLYEVPPHGEPIEPPAPIVATPFAWRDEKDIPARQWLYGRHLLRRFVSVDVAAGGTGKSSVKIGEALAMASNRDLYGSVVHDGPLAVWLYNLEDPAEESERRIHATAKWFHIKPEDVDGRLYVDSGREQRCVIATETEYGARIAQPVYEQIKAQLLERKIDVLVIDPFVSSHEVSENDNRAIDSVVKAWGRLADECNCSINLVHHVRKGNGTETNADSARGAKALVDAARSVQVFNRMTPDEASLAGIAEDQRGFYFRVQNDKANLAPPDKAAWYRMNNVSLDNGDQVGVACPWKWPELFEGVSTRHLIAVQKAVDAGEWRFDSRSPQWAGHAVAQVLDLDAENARKRILKLLKEWIENGALKVVDREAGDRHKYKFVEVGRWAAE